MPAQLTNLKVRDVAIKLHRAGRGPTVLFLHGAGGVPQWLPFFEALAERSMSWYARSRAAVPPARAGWRRTTGR